MSDSVWHRRGVKFCKGYALVLFECMNEYYDWEEDPMCDCTPARKYKKPTGNWELRVHRTYAYMDEHYNPYGDSFSLTSRKNGVTEICHVVICDEGFSTNSIPENVLDTLVNKLTAENIPFNKARELLEDTKLTIEAEELIP